MASKKEDTITKMPNAWVVKRSEKVHLDDFNLSMASDGIEIPDIEDDDVVIVVEERSGHHEVVAIARVFRKRILSDKVVYYFDGIVRIEPNVDIASSGLDFNASAVHRLDWSTFENILKETCVFKWSKFPVIDGKTPHEQAYVRDLLQYSMEDDLLGPAGGPYEEIIGMSVRDRYLVGKLAPMMPTDTADVDGIKNTLSSDENEAPGDLVVRANPDHISMDKAPVSSSSDEQEEESDASKNRSLVPSSLGFTFCVGANVDTLELIVNWGRYQKTDSERINEETGKPYRCWKRMPAGGKTKLSLMKKDIERFSVDDSFPGVVLKGSVSEPLETGDRLVTLFLINTYTKPEENQDEAWVFQPEMIVKGVDGKPVFHRRPIADSIGVDDEMKSLEMIYRRRVEFAVGHGISVHAVASEDDPEHAIEIRTSVLPRYDVPITETPGLLDEDRSAMKRMVADGLMDMEKLAEMDVPDLESSLQILTDDYEVWISEQRTRVDGDVHGFDEQANSAMDRCTEIFSRLRDGISVLVKDAKALEAFRFSNRAMASQRIRSIYALMVRRGEKPDYEKLNVAKNRSWRPFQLAFVLLSIPALADPAHRDRTDTMEAYADLLWFPTGGGKTEAYLGVAAFTMAIRRLQGEISGFDSSRGLAVIMRYTLRLLTIQQFQRATALICAMEIMRRADIEKWGSEPFTIGLWVGQRVTPNSTEESHNAIQRYRNGQRYGTSSPAQLMVCPWCGAEIREGKDIEVKRFDNDIGRTLIYCGDPLNECEFGRVKSKDLGIPVIVVDEELYRRPPSMLIATVDKFAMMSWRGQIRTLFGKASEECPRHGLLWPGAECSGNHHRNASLAATDVKRIKPIRPPDLIIQDEFHLISGPLGTMVGLYETAVDELSAWPLGDKTVRPKIIASTATVRKAGAQVGNVFLRQVSVFPPHGLDIEDNFFSVQRPIKKNPGRRYMGICSPGSSRPAVLIRVYVALLTAAKCLYDRFGNVADPYMTLVGYFNSLRELGGMRRLAEDDVQTRSYRVQMSDVYRPGLSQRSVRNVDELTSRVSSKDIPKKLDQLEVQFKNEWAKGETRAIDVVLATNMLSVGVDVNRLGVMAVNGQPKNTAEYIQATSRVGRFYPGLICTVLTWSRPRDLSHYESFEHYHSTFYKHVEAQSVTPFAPRALDRGLTGLMVGMLRLGNDDLNGNLGAQKLDGVRRDDVEFIKKAITERAWKVKSRDAGVNAEKMISDRVDRWVKEALRPGRRLGYETERKQGDVVGLLKRPSMVAWDEFTVPLSMREVEPGVGLIMDTVKMSDSPEWCVMKKDEGKKRDGGAG